MKILIIDDHVVVREGVRRLLTTLPDTEVFEAASARDALALYRSRRHPIFCSSTSTCRIRAVLSSFAGCCWRIAR